MKKLAFLFAAVVAVSFASCGNTTAQNEETADTIDTTAVETCDTTSCADTTACDSVAAPVAE
ncbi:MAG: hypothetical protein IKQ51_07740 [Bacteroidaceae bacterium]|nr:hypothetical protein [Bacteroidaceae bacterium]